jgi:hypothetical protein
MQGGIAIPSFRIDRQGYNGKRVTNLAVHIASPAAFPFAVLACSLSLRPRFICHSQRSVRALLKRSRKILIACGR